MGTQTQEAAEVAAALAAVQTNVDANSQVPPRRAVVASANPRNSGKKNGSCHIFIKWQNAFRKI